MRILFCNKYNHRFSGTEVYIFEAMELLRAHGHEVALFSMADEKGQPTPYDRHFVPNVDFKAPAGWSQKLLLAFHAIYFSEARRRIRMMIAEFKPDVAPVRNIYHHLSPSILWELKRQKVPVLYHLNDFKVLCPSYNLVSRREACERCKGGSFWHAFREKCYPGWSSRIALVAEAYVHKWLGTYRKCVDCFLAPSQFVRDKFVEHGWNSKKFVVLPHFQQIGRVPTRPPENAPVLYFGRLSAEKGVEDLLRAMQQLADLHLVVAGEGPERRNLEQTASSLGLTNVIFAGQLCGADLDAAISNSRFTVLPSHAYETLGKTILESYARAKAVIATDFGSRRELVHKGTTGLLYETGNVDELASAIRFLYSNPDLSEKMGLAAYDQIRLGNTPVTHYQTLIRLYENLIRRNLNEARGLERETENAFAAASLPRESQTNRTQVAPRRLALVPVVSEAPNPPRAPTQRRLRIAFIGGRGLVSKYSGIETYYEEIGKALADRGHEMVVYCRNYFTPSVKQHNGMEVVRLPTIRSKHLETVLHTFLSTLHVLWKGCDVVHFHALGPALFSFIPRLMGKKTVVTVQGLDWKRKKWGRLASAVLRLGERAAVKMPTKTMVVSQSLQRYYGLRYGAQTWYVPNGGVMRQRHMPVTILDWGLDPGQYILFLGRFSPEKGCHLLLDAYERLNPDVKLVMAGASSYCENYARQLQARANDKIKMMDWVSGAVLDELLTNAMIFVLPSDLEGLSLALLDAMGAGLCVLASDVVENREAIGGAGFTFRSGDVADLAHCLQFLIANPAVRESAGKAAKLRVREAYQWPKIALEVEKVYFEMMGWKSVQTAPKKPSGRAADSPAIPQRHAG